MIMLGIYWVKYNNSIIKVIFTCSFCIYNVATRTFQLLLCKVTFVTCIIRLLENIKSLANCQEAGFIKYVF